MGKRREARETALQFLFSHDLNKELNEQDRESFWNLRRTTPQVRAFAEELITGVRTHSEQLDTLLVAALDNFDLNRVSPVERNILRIAAFELYHLPEVPAPVCINEAIEVAKRFGSTDSGRFINGVLDRLRRERNPA